MMEKKEVLVTGGAGYIGAHAVYALLDGGYAPVVLDDLSTGVRENLPNNIPFYRGCVGDVSLLDRVFSERKIAGVLHFAGSIIVPESVADPAKYYRNNTCNSLNLIRTCAGHGIGAFIFSSTAAVYGEPAEVPVREDSALAPINPYGRSKLMTEEMLRDVAAASGGAMCFAILRYFNVAGADPRARCGQAGPNATHLIKIACEAASGQRTGMEIFGTDYPTPDGTCLRDYIHVSDLADLHVRALEHIWSGTESLTANCGYGRGFSVREVIGAVEKVAGRHLNVTLSPRRAGDPVRLVADSARIRTLLRWTPKHDDLEFIVRTALEWESVLAERKKAWQKSA